jgi:hypothetical protein
MSYVPTFSYDPANPAIFYPRLLISDTVQFGKDGVTPIYVFSDQEIQAMTTIVTLNWQSAQFYSPPAGQQLPGNPIPYMRIAAGLLDCIAANKSKLASITRILDVELSPSVAAKMLREMAQEYRDVDDNSGSFCLIEQVNDDWSLISRYWKQVQRMQGVGF